ncbi:M23 family metallopeptidase [Pseudenhygromyxa sp. WMMC2535]|uniref:M23 family metallopeptidase n=1 Tax=Pseudenhygromyxa sp. WMMC2535 TaxID=2712867 RepID=UPI001557176C|nr:M23 family metallopeptidase [Pseudenhygromyxa sp. WMMC2535]NVB39155.1 M23 family metallopeptidase [Pseudenhygromyxa sp. WMMC2535]
MRTCSLASNLPVVFVVTLAACSPGGGSRESFGFTADSVSSVGADGADEIDTSDSLEGGSGESSGTSTGGESSTGTTTAEDTGSSSESSSSESGDSSSEEDGGVPNTSDGGDNGGPPCSSYASDQGWGTYYCDNGNGICEGDGVVSDDCDLCCSGPSCGEYAGLQGWDWANCEWNENGACNGQGTPTYDCEVCCGGVDGGSTTTTGGGGGGFGYPVGDKTSYPAGGWQVWQVLGHYWSAYSGRHLAQDIAAPGGGVAGINAPVYAVADGVVRYAGSNGSSYKNVVLIEHDDGEGGSVCSFYGHVNPPIVSTGDQVVRGQQITSVRDWALCLDGGSSTNTHMHYVLLSKTLCDVSAANSGGSICGYDAGGPSDVDTLAEEPYYYTPMGCGYYQDGFISPTQFIEDHHF